MLTAITVILAIQLLFSLFFKVDRSMAFCGIFAFSGKKNLTKEQRERALFKMKILGFYNETRGGQGAGIFINNQIIKCGERLKTFPDLISNYIPEIPDENMIMIAHCRKMSRGIVSTENTHPFLINNDLVGVHNGTIENMDDIAKEADVDIKGLTNDSRQLFTVIEAKGTDVLEQYKGGAALIWTRISEPNVLYLFHGASKKYSTSGVVEEERPLFYLNTDEGVYLSSMENSLWAIRDNDNQIPQFVMHNRVFTLVDGKMSKKVVTVVREEANVPKNFYYNGGTNSSTNNNYGRNSRNYDDYDDVFGHRASSQHVSNARSSAVTNGAITGESMVWRETLPEPIKHHLTFKKSDLDRVYFHKGRFYEKPGQLLQGAIFLSKKGFYEKENDYAQTYEYYFYNGVMIRTKKLWDELQSALLSNDFTTSDYANFAMIISKYSEFPVTNLPSESTRVNPSDRYKWYLDFRPFNGSFTPQFSLGRHYKINYAGYLIEIEAKMKKDKTTLYTNMSERTKDMEKIMNRTGGSGTEIPFRKDGTDDKEGEEQGADALEFNDPYFDAEFADANAIIKNLPDTHINAILSYLRMEYEEMHGLDPDDKELEELVETLCITVATTFRTIREVLDDENGMLEQIMNFNNVPTEDDDANNDIDDDKVDEYPAPGPDWKDPGDGDDNTEEAEFEEIDPSGKVIPFNPPREKDQAQMVLDEIDVRMRMRNEMLAKAAASDEKESKLNNNQNEI